jgi:hypothetical protein
MIAEVCAIYGATVKPLMAQRCAYDSSMRLNYRKILADNVNALKDASQDLTSGAKIAAKCPKVGVRKIGKRTIDHLLETDGPQPQLDTIVGVAEAFQTKPWLLLMPDFDAKSKTVPMIELAQLIIDLLSKRPDLLSKISGS